MGQYCVARWRLSSSVTLPASKRAGRRAVGRPTVHGGPVVLRPVRATPRLISFAAFRKLCEVFVVSFTTDAIRIIRNQRVRYTTTGLDALTGMPIAQLSFPGDSKVSMLGHITVLAE